MGKSLLHAFILFYFLYIFSPLFPSCVCSPCYAPPPLFFFQTEVEPILAVGTLIVPDVSISEGVPTKPITGVKAISAKAGIFTGKKDFAIADAHMEKFLVETDITIDTKIPATDVLVEDISAEDTTLVAEASLFKKRASIEKEVPKGLCYAPKGTSVEATTPLKEGTSLIGGQPERTSFFTPFLIISSDDPFTSFH